MKHTLEFDSLDAGTGKLLEVRLSNCATLPCVFKKGTSTTIEMDFIPGKCLRKSKFLWGEDKCFQRCLTQMWAPTA